VTQCPSKTHYDLPNEKNWMMHLHKTENNAALIVEKLYQGADDLTEWDQLGSDWRNTRMYSAPLSRVQKRSCLKDEMHTPTTRVPSAPATLSHCRANWR